MWRSSIRIVGGPYALAALLAGSEVAAQESPRPRKDAVGAAVGATVYRTFCASCHGTTGKGDGPMARELKSRVPDITQLRKNNRGEYPFERVLQTVDGRAYLKGHGADMPVWGDSFRKTREDYDDARVKERITQLVLFIETLQE